MHVQQMMTLHPQARGGPGQELLNRCVEAAYDCAQICIACADACLGEQDVVRLRQCIRMNLDCGDICLATGSTGTRRTGANTPTLMRLLETCAVACAACAQECSLHAADHPHCRLCADACRRCEDLCRQVLTVLQTTVQ